MSNDAKPDHFDNTRNAQSVTGEGTGELFPESKNEIFRAMVESNRLKSDGRRPPPQPSVYLWLCCEGWMRFGPFEWLRFDDNENAIIGPDGEVVAKKTDGYWRVPDGRGEGMQFSNPTITTTPFHPHRGSGSHPAKVR